MEGRGNCCLLRGRKGLKRLPVPMRMERDAQTGKGGNDMGDDPAEANSYRML